VKAAMPRTEAPQTPWRIWLSALGLWLLTSAILVAVTVGLVVAFVTWLVATPLLAVIAMTRGGRS